MNIHFSSIISNVAYKNSFLVIVFINPLKIKSWLFIRLILVLFYVRNINEH